MTRKMGRAVRVVLGLLTALLISGCVSVPDSGPVSVVSPSGTVPPNRGTINVRPPAPDATPTMIVQGFLQGMAEPQSNYAQARQFLAAGARDAWNPDGVLIYPSDVLPQANGNQIVLNVPHPTGQLGGDGSFSRSDQSWRFDFGLVLDGGEWRIGHPPETLLLSEQLFRNIYRSYNLYFFDPSYSHLVPDPVYLPYAPAADEISAALVQRLIQGPTSFLAASVRNAIPAQTQLQTQSVVVADGIADVSLSEPVLSLNDLQRTLLVAEIAWTLNQVNDVRGVRINEGSLPVSGSVGQGAQAYVPFSAVSSYGPVPTATTSLFGLQGSRMVEVADVDAPAQPRPVPGPLGEGKLDLASVAVSTAAGRVAAVTRNDELWVGGWGQAPTRVVRDVGHLLRPQVTGSGGAIETWTVSQRGPTAKVWLVRGTTVTRVASGELPDGKVMAFRLSADGARIAIVRKTDNGSEVGLMAVDRGTTRTVLRNWRPIDLSRSDVFDVNRVIDVAWQAPTSLLVLGSTNTQSSVDPYAVAQDGSEVDKIGLSDDWGAVAVTAAPRTPSRAVVVGAHHQSWRFVSQSNWQYFSDAFRFLTYAG